MRSRPPEPVSISDRLIKQVGELTPSHHQIRRVARRISPTTRYSHHTTPSYRLKSAEHVPPDKSLGKHSPKPATALARNDHPISLPPPKVNTSDTHPSLPPPTLCSTPTRVHVAHPHPEPKHSTAQQQCQRIHSCPSPNPRAAAKQSTQHPSPPVVRNPDPLAPLHPARRSG